MAGVEPQSETVWRQADKYKVPRICFINKLDRMGANFEKSLASIHERLTPFAVPLTIPMGLESEFEGVIDLFEMKAIYFEGEHGEKMVIKEIPEKFKADAEKWRKTMIEKIAESEIDDEIMEQYLNNKEPSIDAMKKALRQGCLQYKFVPVYCGSAF